MPGMTGLEVIVAIRQQYIQFNLQIQHAVKDDTKVWLQLPLFVMISCLSKEKITLISQNCSAMPDIILTKPYNVQQLQ